MLKLEIIVPYGNSKPLVKTKYGHLVLVKMMMFSMSKLYIKGEMPSLKLILLTKHSPKSWYFLMKIMMLVAIYENRALQVQ